MGSHCSAPVDILLKAGFVRTRASGTTRLDAANISQVLAKPARLGTCREGSVEQIWPTYPNALDVLYGKGRAVLPRALGAQQ